MEHEHGLTKEKLALATEEMRGKKVKGGFNEDSDEEDDDVEIVTGDMFIRSAKCINDSQEQFLY